MIIFCFYRLDTILGKAGSKAIDVYESKISLASRIVKVERSVSINSVFIHFLCVHALVCMRACVCAYVCTY